MSLTQRLGALASHGVRCSDVDVVMTKDGHLLVGHPLQFKVRAAVRQSCTRLLS